MNENLDVRKARQLALDGVGVVERYVVFLMIAIWLILPVVICLSQRLSHAGLSPWRNKVRPRMAHYISYGSLDLRLHLDNPGNSRANTCTITPTLGKVCFY